MRTPMMVLAALGIAAVSARAQQPAPLTLDQVYQELAGRSPRIEAARAQVAAAQARIAPAGKWPDPAIQLGLMNRNLPGLGLQDPLGMNQIQIMQMIPTAGKTGLAVKAAKADARAEAARAEETGWEVRARAAMVFYDLYQTDGTIAEMRRGRRLLEDVVRTASTMYAEGQGPQAAALRSQMELARMDEDLMRMSAMREGMAVRLNSLLGRASDEPVGPSRLPQFPDSLPSRDSLERLALSHRPMLAAGAARVEAAGALSRKAGREIWPDVTVGLIYGQRPMSDGGTDRMASFMLGFNLPLTAGGKQRQMEKEARAMEAMSAADLNDMRAETRGRLGEAYADLFRARELRELYRRTLLPQAEAVSVSALTSYRIGAVDFMALLDAEMSLIRARQEVFRFDAETGKAIAELEMLTASVLMDPAGTTHAGDER
jgi:outer membrane protein, heavy metal efflux system